MAVIVMLIALACSLWVNFGLRMPVESQDRTVGLLVDYDELKRIADASYDIEFSDMLRKASVAGATGLVIRERTLIDWEIAGDILIISGGNLNLHLEAMHEGFATMGIEVAPEKTYILTKDRLVHEQILTSLETKRRYPESFTLNEYMGIAAQLHSAERSSLGMGFPLKQLEEAAAEGYQIIPRVRNWEPVSGESISETFRWLGSIPNLAAVGFNEQNVLGDASNPIILGLPDFKNYLDALEAAITPLGVPLVSFEFYDQEGLSAIAARLDNSLIRAHAISENELHRYFSFQAAIDRYTLAASERNIRYIYVRFYGLLNPAASMERNMDLVSEVRQGLVDDGLIVGNPEPIEAESIPMLAMFFLGTGVLAAGGWLVALAAENFTGKKWRLPYALLILLGFAAWAGVLIVTPLLGRKLMALAGAVIFPSLSVCLILKRPAGSLPGGLKLLRAAIMLLAISAFTIAGAMIVSAILSEQRFMLKLDSFLGVKPAHIVPLALVPAVLWLREKDWFPLLSATAKSSVRFWQLGVCFALLAGVTMYILRTGNEAPEAVTGLELSFRQMLDNALGVRPRTTEFLIGHPLMLVLLYYGYRFNMFPVLMIGLMGQVSLLNTYAHIHTPLRISLQRSFHGGWIGLAIGIVFIGILELVFFRMRKSRLKTIME